MTRSPRPALVALLCCVCCVLLTGCFGSDDDPPATQPSYDPVADDELFAEVAGIPGVKSAELEYVDTFENPNSYAGTITLVRGTDAAEVLDRTCAILWQGRPDVSVFIDVPLGGAAGSTNTADLRLSAPTDREAPYGAQPGTGQPPADASPLPKVPGQP